MVLLHQKLPWTRKRRVVLGFGSFVVRYSFELKEILELLIPGSRVNPFPEHIVLHMKAVEPDLISDPLDVLRRDGSPLRRRRIVGE